MIFITGASSGIGAACAESFAKQGHSLILMARRQDRLEALRKKLTQEHSVEVVVFVGDVCDRPAIANWFRENEKLASRIEVLVNNAGLAKGLSTIQEGDLGDWDVMLDTNIKGLLNVTHAILPFF